MIKTLLFDFGDVFINLDKTAPQREFSKIGMAEKFIPDIEAVSQQYEVGKITTATFMKCLQENVPKASLSQILAAWNSILLDFPESRFTFLKELANKKQYQLILLSNTNEAHIDYIKENVPFFEDFKACFNAFYLSYEIGFRKPNADIYEHVLNTHQLIPEEILFIDDTLENTDAAGGLGIRTWNIIPGKQDIVNLFTIQSKLL